MLAPDREASVRISPDVSPYLSNDGHGAIAAQYLNKAAFAVNALGTYGVLGRNTYRGPGSFNLDYGLHKDFPVHESHEVPVPVRSIQPV